MDLIVNLDSEALQRVQQELEAIYTYTTRTKRVVCDLDSITLVDFCSCILRNINMDEILTVYSYVKQLRLLCHVFDAVDIDSRGVISWTDFTTFCLRMGRIYLSPSFVMAGTMYTQAALSSQVLPIEALMYSKHLRLLFAIDTDTSTIRTFNENCTYISKFNPIKELERMKKVQAASGIMSLAKRKQLKEAVAEAAPKVSILCACSIDKVQKVVLCSSDCHLIFCSEAEGNLHVVGFARAENPQCGIVYCAVSQLLVSWPGDPSNHMFQIWDPVRMILLYQVSRHSCLIRAACEVCLRDDSEQSATHVEVDYMASCSIDRKVLLWPITALTKRTVDSSLRKAEEVVELKGHVYAIRSLVYARAHDLLLGAGFDYDIYAWDPWTRRLQMKLSGHMHSIIGLQLVYVPHERVVSMDTSGLMKVWSLGHAHSTHADILQSMQVLPTGKESLILADFVAVSEGKSIAVLASNRVYQFKLNLDHVDDLRPLAGGLGYCERMGRMWLITRRAINQARLRDGESIRRLALADDDRLDVKKMEQELLKQKLTMTITEESSPKKGEGQHYEGHDAAHGHGHGHGHGLDVATHHHHNHHVHSAEGNLEMLLGHNFAEDAKETQPDAKEAMAIHHAAVSDIVSAVTSDVLGKKIFIGTMEGNVMIFDSASCGLIQHLGKPSIKAMKGIGGDVGVTYHSQGAVTSMKYCERDELLIVVFCWGAIKVFSGCNKSRNAVVETPIPRHPPEEAHFPGGCGGHTPPNILLYRECDYNFDQSHDYAVVAAAFSESFNVICQALRNGLVRVFDYVNLTVTAVLQSPLLSGQSIENTDVCMLALLPVVLVSDSTGRVHMFSLSPLNCQWMCSLCPASLFGDSSVAPVSSRMSNSESSGAIRTMTSVFYQFDKSANQQSKEAQFEVGVGEVPAKSSHHPLGKTPPTGTATAKSGKKIQCVPPKLVKYPFRFKSYSDSSQAKVVEPIHHASVELEPVEKTTKSKGGGGGGVKFSVAEESDAAAATGGPHPTSSQKSAASQDHHSTKFVGVHARRKSRSASNSSINTAVEAEVEDQIISSWILLVGDDIGRIYQIDLTKALIKCDCIKAKYTGVLPPAFNPYVELRSTRLFHGLTPLAVVNLEQQLRRPIGSHVTEFTRSVNGVNSRDFLALRKWTAFSNVAVRVITPVVDTRGVYFVGTEGAVKTKPPSEPPSIILAASDVSIVKAWTWTGDYLGVMSEEPSDEVPEVPHNLLKKFKKQQTTMSASAAPEMGDITRVEVASSIINTNLSSMKLGTGTIASPRVPPLRESKSAITVLVNPHAPAASNSSQTILPSVEILSPRTEALRRQQSAPYLSLFNPEDDMFQDSVIFNEKGNAVGKDESRRQKKSNGWKIPKHLQGRMFDTFRPQGNDAALSSTTQQEVANLTISTAVIDRDYIGALTAWVLPHIGVVEMEIMPGKWKSVKDNRMRSSIGMESSLGGMAPPGLSPRTTIPENSTTGVSYMETLASTVTSFPTPAVHVPDTHVSQVASHYEEKFFNAQFIDMYVNKMRSFGESCSHAPLDYGDAESLDPHDFQASVLDIVRKDAFTQLMEETELVRQRGLAHLDMASEFHNVWGAKVRFKHLETELDKGVFNSFPDPDFALGKSKYVSIVKRKSKRATGIDFVVEKEIKKCEALDPELFQNLQSSKGKSLKSLKQPLPKISSCPELIGDRHSQGQGDDIGDDFWKPVDQMAWQVQDPDFGSAGAGAGAAVTPVANLKPPLPTSAKQSANKSESATRSSKMEKIIDSFGLPDDLWASRGPLGALALNQNNLMMEGGSVVGGVDVIAPAPVAAASTTGKRASFAPDVEGIAELATAGAGSDGFQDSKPPIRRTSRARPVSAPAGRPDRRSSNMTQDQSKSSAPESTATPELNPKQEQERRIKEALAARLEATTKKFEELTKDVPTEEALKKQREKEIRKEFALVCEREKVRNGIVDIAKAAEAKKIQEDVKNSMLRMPEYSPAQRNRYGPYTPKEFYWFVDIVIKMQEHRLRHTLHSETIKQNALASVKVVVLGEDLLPIETKEDSKKKSLMDAGLFIDDTHALSVECALLVLEAIPGSQEIRGVISGLPTQSVEKMDLIKVFFPHAYTQEQSRILIFSKATELMRSIMLTAKEPTSRGDGRRNGVCEDAKIDPKDAKAIHNFLMLKLSQQRRINLASKLASGCDNPFMTVLGEVKPAVGLQGWRIPHHLLLDAVDQFEVWAAADCGTVSFHDLIDIVLSMLPQTLLIECKPLLQTGARLNAAGYTLTSEVDGKMFKSFIEVGLKMSSI